MHKCVFGKNAGKSCNTHALSEFRKLWLQFYNIAKFICFQIYVSPFYTLHSQLFTSKKLQWIHEKNFKHENLTTMNVLQYFYSPYWVDPLKPFLCCLHPAIFQILFILPTLFVVLFLGLHVWSITSDLICYFA